MVSGTGPKGIANALLLCVTWLSRLSGNLVHGASHPASLSPVPHPLLSETSIYLGKHIRYGRSDGMRKNILDSGESLSCAYLPRPEAPAYAHFSVVRS